MSAALLVKVGKAYVDRGDCDKAVAPLTQAIEQSPELAEADHLLGLCFSRQEDYRPAIRHLDRAVAADPKRYDAFLLLGMAKDLSRDHAGAAEVYRRAVAAEPGRPEAHRELGNTLLLLDKPAEAAASLWTAVRLADAAAPPVGPSQFGPPRAPPGADAELLDEYGHALLVGGRCAEAEKVLARATARDARSADAHTHLGDARACLDRDDDAVAAYEAAIALDRDQARAWFHLGLLRSKKGDAAGAKAALAEAARLLPGDAKVREARARLEAPPPRRTPAR